METKSDTETASIADGIRAADKVAKAEAVRIAARTAADGKPKLSKRAFLKSILQGTTLERTAAGIVAADKVAKAKAVPRVPSPVRNRSPVRNDSSKLVHRKWNALAFKRLHPSLLAHLEVGQALQRSFDDQGGEDQGGEHLVVNVSDKPASAGILGMADRPVDGTVDVSDGLASAKIPGKADRPVDWTVNGGYWADAECGGDDDTADDCTADALADCRFESGNSFSELADLNALVEHDAGRCGEPGTRRGRWSRVRRRSSKQRRGRPPHGTGVADGLREWQVTLKPWEWCFADGLASAESRGDRKRRDGSGVVEEEEVGGGAEGDDVHRRDGSGVVEEEEVGGGAEGDDVHRRDGPASVENLGSDHDTVNGDHGGGGPSVVEQEERKGDAEGEGRDAEDVVVKKKDVGGVWGVQAKLGSRLAIGVVLIMFLLVATGQTWIASGFAAVGPLPVAGNSSLGVDLWSCPAACPGTPSSGGSVRSLPTSLVSGCAACKVTCCAPWMLDLHCCGDVEHNPGPGCAGGEGTSQRGPQGDDDGGCSPIPATTFADSSGAGPGPISGLWGMGWCSVQDSKVPCVMALCHIFYGSGLLASSNTPCICGSPLPQCVACCCSTIHEAFVQSLTANVMAPEATHAANEAMRSMCGTLYSGCVDASSPWSPLLLRHALDHVAESCYAYSSRAAEVMPVSRRCSLERYCQAMDASSLGGARVNAWPGLLRHFERHWVSCPSCSAPESGARHRPQARYTLRVSAGTWPSLDALLSSPVEGSACKLWPAPEYMCETCGRTALISGLDVSHGCTPDVRNKSRAGAPLPRVLLVELPLYCSSGKASVILTEGVPLCTVFGGCEYNLCVAGFTSGPSASSNSSIGIVHRVASNTVGSWVASGGPTAPLHLGGNSEVGVFLSEKLAENRLTLLGYSLKCPPGRVLALSPRHPACASVGVEAATAPAATHGLQRPELPGAEGLEILFGGVPASGVPGASGDAALPGSLVSLSHGGHTAFSPGAAWIRNNTVDSSHVIPLYKVLWALRPGTPVFLLDYVNSSGWTDCREGDAVVSTRDHPYLQGPEHESVLIARCSSGRTAEVLGQIQLRWLCELFVPVASRPVLTCVQVASLCVASRSSRQETGLASAYGTGCPAAPVVLSLAQCSVHVAAVPLRPTGVWDGEASVEERAACPELDVSSDSSSGSQSCGDGGRALLSPRRGVVQGLTKRGIVGSGRRGAGMKKACPGLCNSRSASCDSIGGDSGEDISGASATAGASGSPAGVEATKRGIVGSGRKGACMKRSRGGLCSRRNDVSSDSSGRDVGDESGGDESAVAGASGDDTGGGGKHEGSADESGRNNPTNKKRVRGRRHGRSANRSGQKNRTQKRVRGRRHGRSANRSGQKNRTQKRVPGRGVSVCRYLELEAVGSESGSTVSGVGSDADRSDAELSGDFISRDRLMSSGDTLSSSSDTEGVLLGLDLCHLNRTAQDPAYRAVAAMQVERVCHLLGAPLLRRQASVCKFHVSFVCSRVEQKNKNKATLSVLEGKAAAATSNLTRAVKAVLESAPGGPPAPSSLEALKRRVQAATAAVAREEDVDDVNLAKLYAEVSKAVAGVTNVRRAAWLTHYGGLAAPDAALRASADRRAAGDIRKVGLACRPIAFGLRSKMRAAGTFVSGCGVRDEGPDPLDVDAVKRWHGWLCGPDVDGLGCPEDHFVLDGGRVRRGYRCGIRGATCVLWRVELARRSMAALCLSGGGLVRAIRARCMERSFRLPDLHTEASRTFKAAMSGNNRCGAICGSCGVRLLGPVGVVARASTVPSEVRWRVMDGVAVGDRGLLLPPFRDHGQYWGRSHRGYTMCAVGGRAKKVVCLPGWQFKSTSGELDVPGGRAPVGTAGTPVAVLSPPGGSEVLPGGIVEVVRKDVDSGAVGVVRVGGTGVWQVAIAHCPPCMASIAKARTKNVVYNPLYVGKGPVFKRLSSAQRRCFTALELETSMNVSSGTSSRYSRAVSSHGVNHGTDGAFVFGGKAGDVPLTGPVRMAVKAFRKESPAFPKLYIEVLLGNSTASAGSAVLYAGSNASLRRLAVGGGDARTDAPHSSAGGSTPGLLGVVRPLDNAVGLHAGALSSVRAGRLFGTEEAVSFDQDEGRFTAECLLAPLDITPSGSWRVAPSGSLHPTYSVWGRRLCFGASGVLRENPVLLHFLSMAYDTRARAATGLQFAERGVVGGTSVAGVLRGMQSRRNVSQLGPQLSPADVQQIRRHVLRVLASGSAGVSSDVFAGLVGVSPGLISQFIAGSEGRSTMVAKALQNVARRCSTWLQANKVTLVGATSSAGGVGAALQVTGGAGGSGTAGSTVQLSPLGTPVTERDERAVRESLGSLGWFVAGGVVSGPCWGEEVVRGIIMRLRAWGKEDRSKAALKAHPAWKNLLAVSNTSILVDLRGKSAADIQIPSGKAKGKAFVILDNPKLGYFMGSNRRMLPAGQFAPIASHLQAWLIWRAAVVKSGVFRESEVASVLPAFPVLEPAVNAVPPVGGMNSARCPALVSASSVPGGGVSPAGGGMDPARGAADMEAALGGIRDRCRAPILETDKTWRGYLNNLSEECIMGDILADAPGSARYWQHKLADLQAYVVAFGLPAYFVTITMNEGGWDDLAKAVGGKGKAFKDPCVTTDHYLRRIDTMMRMLVTDPDGPQVFGRVRHMWGRQEEQGRSSLHWHGLIWVEGAAVEGVTDLGRRCVQCALRGAAEKYAWDGMADSLRERDKIRFLGARSEGLSIDGSPCLCRRTGPAPPPSQRTALPCALMSTTPRPVWPDSGALKGHGLCLKAGVGCPFESAERNRKMPVSVTHSGEAAEGVRAGGPCLCRDCVESHLEEGGADRHCAPFVDDDARLAGMDNTEGVERARFQRLVARDACPLCLQDVHNRNQTQRALVGCSGQSSRCVLGTREQCCRNEKCKRGRGHHVSCCLSDPQFRCSHLQEHACYDPSGTPRSCRAGKCVAGKCTRQKHDPRCLGGRCKYRFPRARRGFDERTADGVNWRYRCVQPEDEHRTVTCSSLPSAWEAHTCVERVTDAGLTAYVAKYTTKINLPCTVQLGVGGASSAPWESAAAVAGGLDVDYTEKSNALSAAQLALAMCRPGNEEARRAEASALVARAREALAAVKQACRALVAVGGGGHEGTGANCSTYQDAVCESKGAMVNERGGGGRGAAGSKESADHSDVVAGFVQSKQKVRAEGAMLASLRCTSGRLCTFFSRTHSSCMYLPMPMPWRVVHMQQKRTKQHLPGKVLLYEQRPEALEDVLLEDYFRHYQVCRAREQPPKYAQSAGWSLHTDLKARPVFRRRQPRVVRTALLLPSAGEPYFLQLLRREKPFRDYERTGLADVSALLPASYQARPYWALCHLRGILGPTKTATCAFPRGSGDTAGCEDVAPDEPTAGPGGSASAGGLARHSGSICLWDTGDDVNSLAQAWRICILYARNCHMTREWTENAVARAADHLGLHEASLCTPDAGLGGRSLHVDLYTPSAEEGTDQEFAEQVEDVGGLHLLPTDTGGGDLAQLRAEMGCVPTGCQGRALQEVRRVLSGEQVLLFVTGAGGVGKTKLLRRVLLELRQAGKAVHACATTALAALYLGADTGAKTFHSFLGLTPGGGTGSQVRPGTSKYLRLGYLDAVIIDEVSMLSSEQLCELDRVLRRTCVDERKRNMPFGGKSVILFGDLYQLPTIPPAQPVYDAGELWDSFRVASLSTQMRQDDAQFAGTLSRLRCALWKDLRPEDRALILSREVSVLETGGVTVDPAVSDISVAPHRATVEKVNAARLRLHHAGALRDGGLRVFESEDSFLRDGDTHGWTGASHRPRRVQRTAVGDSVRASIGEKVAMSTSLELVVGAPVVMIKHHRTHPTCVNGARGTVRGFHTSKTGKETVLVGSSRFPGRIWRITRVREVKCVPVPDHQRGTNTSRWVERRQYPLQLAYCFTVHKMQGATEDVNVHLHLKGAWEEGQVYVALSRVRRSTQLFIHGFSPETLRPSEGALVAMARARACGRVVEYDSKETTCDNCGVAGALSSPCTVCPGRRDHRLCASCATRHVDGSSMCSGPGVPPSTAAASAASCGTSTSPVVPAVDRNGGDGTPLWATEHDPGLYYAPARCTSVASGEVGACGRPGALGVDAAGAHLSCAGPPVGSTSAPPSTGPGTPAVAAVVGAAVSEMHTANDDIAAYLRTSVAGGRVGTRALPGSVGVDPAGAATSTNDAHRPGVVLPVGSKSAPVPHMARGGTPVDEAVVVAAEDCCLGEDRVDEPLYTSAAEGYSSTSEDDVEELLHPSAAGDGTAANLKATWTRGVQRLYRSSHGAREGGPPIPYGPLPRAERLAFDACVAICVEARTTAENPAKAAAKHAALSLIRGFPEIGGQWRLPTILRRGLQRAKVVVHLVDYFSGSSTPCNLRKYAKNLNSVYPNLVSISAATTATDNVRQVGHTCGFVAASALVQLKRGKERGLMWSTVNCRSAVDDATWREGTRNLTKLDAKWGGRSNEGEYWVKATEFESLTYAYYSISTQLDQDWLDESMPLDGFTRLLQDDLIQGVPCTRYVPVNASNMGDAGCHWSAVAYSIEVEVPPVQGGVLRSPAQDHQEDPMDGIREGRNTAAILRPTGGPPATRNGDKSGHSTTTETGCERCGGEHHSHECHHYKLARGTHYSCRMGDTGQTLGTAGGDVTIGASEATVEESPKDGSCLYHSMQNGLSSHNPRPHEGSERTPNAQGLRTRLAKWIQENGDTEIAGTTMATWILWDSRLTVEAYCTRMTTTTAWGGGVEMVAFGHLYGVTVNVFEHSTAANGSYQRMTSFDSHNGGQPVNILYVGQSHYDALIRPIPASPGGRSPVTKDDPITKTK